MAVQKLHKTVDVRRAKRLQGGRPLVCATRRVVRCQAQPGDKVLPMLRSPADLLFLGPRVALGAVLNTSQNLEQLCVVSDYSLLDVLQLSGYFMYFVLSI